MEPNLGGIAADNKGTAADNKALAIMRGQGKEAGIAKHVREELVSGLG